MKLIKFNNMVFYLLGMFILITVFFLTFLFTLNIEVKDNAILKVSSTDNSVLLIDSNIAYKLKSKSSINLQINNKRYLGEIGDVTYFEDNLFEMEIDLNKNDLIKNSTIPVNIIYSKEPLFKYIF